MKRILILISHWVTSTPFVLNEQLHAFNPDNSNRFLLLFNAICAELKLGKIAKQLGSKVDYMSCTDLHSTWNKVVIEYNHELKEKKHA